MESGAESKECLAGDVESQLSVCESYIVLHSPTHTLQLPFKVAEEAIECSQTNRAGLF
jgi:hypothetical protein